MRTLILDGRPFPVVALICPEHFDHPDWTEWERSLGNRDSDFYIPGENGLLFNIEPSAVADDWWHMHLYSRHCEMIHEASTGESLWLPIQIGLKGRKLYVHANDYNMQLTWGWTNAAEDWIVETIDRLSRLQMPPLDGPVVKLVDPEELVRDSQEIS